MTVQKLTKLIKIGQVTVECILLGFYGPELQPNDKPKLPLSSASASGGFRSLSIARSCGLARIMSRSTFGSSGNWVPAVAAPSPASSDELVPGISI